MNNDFNYSEIEQIYDDFTYSKGDFDDLMEDALNDMGKIVKGVKNRHDGNFVSDDVATLMERRGAEFGKALSSASVSNREKWAQKLVEILSVAADMKPDNIESIIKSAFELEKAYKGADSGVLLSVAEKAAFRHPEHLEEIIDVVDKHLQNYGNQATQNEATFQAFKKIYVNAVRKTRDNGMRDRASAVSNDILGKIEILKGNVTVDKLLQQIKNNPANEAAQDAFESGLKMLLKVKPREGVNDVLDNLKAITKIENAEDRDVVYGIVIDSLEKCVSQPEAKLAVMFKAFDTFLNAEKNPEVRKTFTVTAVSAIKRGLCDENGALAVVAAGVEKETFRSFKRMAESYGNYAGFKDLVANTAVKFQKSPEVMGELKTIMLKALDYEEKNNIKTDAGSRLPFEAEMLTKKRADDNKTRLDAQMYTLLNIPHKTNKYTRDPNKPQMPSKSDMRKAVNLLSQYGKLDDDYLTTCLFSKMDTEKFTNVDDAILDAFERAAPRMKGNSEITEKLTAIRTKMHMQGIQAKKADKMPKEMKNPKERISFSITRPDESYGK